MAILFGEKYDDDVVRADVTAVTVVVLPHGGSAPDITDKAFETSVTPCGLPVRYFAAADRDTVVCRVRHDDGRWLGDVELPYWTTFVMAHDRWVGHVHDTVTRFLSDDPHTCEHEECRDG